MPIVDSKLDLWKSRLLDLSKRNRLLFFKPTKRGNVQIVEPEPSVIFAWLVQDSKKLTFAQHTANHSQSKDSIETIQETEPQKQPLRPGELRTKLSDQQLATTLYNIRQRAKTAVEEQGVNVLYLTFGMFEWRESETSDETVRSPLILVPVELTRSSITKPYTLELLDEEILLNPTLAHKMQIDFHLTFPAMPEEWESVQLEGVLNQTRSIIKGQPRWSIASEVHLGLFSFEKLVMLKDLEVHAQDVKSHPLVVALAGDRSRLPAWPADAFDSDNLDSKIAPSQTFQVLDADSSQQEAIVLAKRGISFVIQGPPGTGKSQTIVNVIAESLAQGKKVLFVSEKMAALEVVYKRLEECRLAEFCLEAHSHKANKSAVVAQLGKSLAAALSAGQTSFEVELRQVADLREQLNRYAKALHEDRTGLHRTPFQVHGELAMLYQAPNLDFVIENIAQIDNEQFSKMQAAVDTLAAMPEVWDSYDSHPWRGTLIQVFSFQCQTEIRSHFGQLITCLSDLEVITTQLAEVLGVQRPTNWADVEPFFRTVALAVDTPFPPEHWLRQPNLAELKKAAFEARQIHTDHTTSSSKLLALHTEAILSLENLPELALRFETTYRNFLRVFNSRYRRDLKIVRSTSISPRKIGYVQALTVLKLAVHVRETQQWIESHHANHQQMFGKLFDGLATRWDDVIIAIDWTESLAARFSGASLPDRLVDILCDQPEGVKTSKELVSLLQRTVEATQREMAYLGTVFPTDHMTFGGVRLEQASLSLLKEGTQLRLDHLDDLGAWIAFQVAWKTAEQNGLGSLLQTAISVKLKSDQLSPAFRKRFYQLWLDAVYAQDATLRDFRGDRQTRLIHQFCTFDREQLSIARKRIVAQLATQRPKSSWVEAPSSEVTILRREMEKKKRHKPIRRLFAEIPNLLLALKPCLMMSPLSVSQFLSSSHFEFDVIIFDEASQICPEDAVSSIMRGTQVIVAGDKHQLPPTPFFKSLGIDFDEWEDDSPSEVLESLLQEWSVLMPSPMLKWHYRSRHESLIAFSNYNIYDNQLITFPNSRVIGDGLGIEFVYVPDGIYDRGKSRKNRVEARHVAELIFQHFAQFPGRSLGVVAFSEAQREAIDEELQHLVQQKPEFESHLNHNGPEAFFVKNLENVQGDERDVIFFSVGYGKDAVGKLTMNFGPLNGEDGARRLNVAITRARYHVKFVSSILPEDIDSAHPNKGVQLLRNYMEYARQGGRREALYGAIDATSGSEAESPFEVAVYQALTDHGLTVHKQVGCSGYRIDLAVVDSERPGYYLLGIECDGAAYHSAKTARDRDRLRQQILEGLGWRIHRIWSRDWIVNPNGQIQKVIDIVLQLKQTSRQTPQPLAAKPLAAGVATDIRADQTSTPTTERWAGVTSVPKGTAVYTYANLPRQGIPDQFYGSGTHSIEQLLLRLVKEESPIHIKVACRRVADCWGISRVGINVESNIRYAVRRLASSKRIELRDEFLWMPDQAGVVVRQPPTGKSPRPIHEIAIEEIAQAAYLCLQDAFSLTFEDLVVQTARLLKYDRTGEKVKKRIRLAVDRLIRENRAVVVNDKVELVSSAHLASGPTSVQ